MQEIEGKERGQKVVEVIQIIHLSAQPILLTNGILNIKIIYIRIPP